MTLPPTLLYRLMGSRREIASWACGALIVAVASLAGCGGAEPTIDAAGPVSSEEPAAAGETRPSGADALVCGTATEISDAEFDVVHWSGSTVESVPTSPFVDIRRVVVSRTESVLCADIETVEPPREPSAFFLLVREWGVPDHGWLVKAEVVLLETLSGARLGYPGAETGPDPRVGYEVVGSHLRIRIPKQAFPDWAWEARFQWHVEARQIDVENRDFEPYDRAPEPCVRIQWPNGAEYASEPNC